MEAAPPLPPVLEVEGALRAWEERELGELRAALGEARWYAELVEEVGEGPAEEALRYALQRYAVPGLLGYYIELIGTSRDASLRESRLGRRFAEDLRRLGPRAAVNRFVGEHLGLRGHPLHGLPVPALPEGVPSVAGPYGPGRYYADAEAAQSLVARPERGVVRGPLFFTRKSHGWELTVGPGHHALVAWFLWEMIYCVLFRFWIPVLVWRGRGPAKVRFRVSIPYTYVTAYALQPLGRTEAPVSLSKIV